MILPGHGKPRPDAPLIRRRGPTPHGCVRPGSHRAGALQGAAESLGGHGEGDQNADDRPRREPPAGLLELVPAARTLFVAYDPHVTTGDALTHTLAGRVAGLSGKRAADAGDGLGVLDVPVRYDGPDLAAVAEHTGLCTAEVVARHTAPLYTVAFSGFAPGFGYLTGTDPALRLPRRAEPRTGFRPVRWQDALTLANRLIGNPEGAATLEATFGGLRLRLRARGPGGTPSVRYMALTGAPCPARLDDGRTVAPNTPIAVYDGQVLELGAPPSGLRTYVAVRGGIDVEPSLGSRATDLLSGLGPAPLTAGALLPVGAPGGQMPGADLAPRAAPPRPAPPRRTTSRDDWFDPVSVRTLYRQPWEATSRSNRVADHPVTGGYPVIGVAHAADLSLAGQIGPGDECGSGPSRGSAVFLRPVRQKGRYWLVRHCCTSCSTSTVWCRSSPCELWPVGPQLTQGASHDTEHLPEPAYRHAPRRGRLPGRRPGRVARECRDDLGIATGPRH